MKNNKKPAYFHQIVIADYLAHRVKIPPLFMKNLAKDLSEEETRNATIKIDNVGIWRVKLRKTSSYTYIEEGWPKIMEDNSLGEMEFLVFRYDGNMRFNLQIFEKTGCERIHPSTIVSGIPMEQFVSEETNVVQGDYTVNFENPHFRRRMTQSNVMKSLTMRFPKDFSTKMSSSERIVIEIENTKGEAWEVKASLNSGTYCLCAGWRDLVSANKLEVGDELIFELIGQDRIRIHKIIHD